MTSYDMERMSSSREIVVSDRRHSAVALRDEPTIVDETISYDVAVPMERSALVRDLRSVIESVFIQIPAKRIYLHDELDFLYDAVSLLRGEQNSVTIYVHRRAIENHLNKLPSILDEILTYSAGERRMRQELLITWSLRSFIRKLKSLLNRTVLRHELDTLSRSNRDLVIALSAEFSSLGLDSNPIVQRRDNNKRKEAAKREVETQQEKIAIQDWLLSISPDLLVAYRETEEIFNEAEALATAPEDEYFLEQVKADYYPHIFESLGKFKGENTDFDVKELVVVESIKQLRIIQLGLQKIIDNTVAQKLTTIKAQTDFLRNKVLGERSFSLTDDEAEVVIDSSVEESQRIREELYKKHVAPKLEKNRQEYEASIAELKTSHQNEFNLLSRTHKQEVARQRVEMQRTYGTEVSLYKNQAREYKTKYSEYLKSAEASRAYQMNKLQQRHDIELTRLKKQYEYNYQDVQRQTANVKALQEEILALQMALVHLQDTANKKQGTVQIEELIHEQHLENSQGFNAAKAELYGSPAYKRKASPSYYRKATEDELCEIYEDDAWYDYEY